MVIIWSGINLGEIWAHIRTGEFVTLVGIHKKIVSDAKMFFFINASKVADEDSKS